jgi:hypothetical protein
MKNLTLLTSTIALLTIAAACHAADDKTFDTNHPHLWILSDLSYETSSSTANTYEFGFGWYGLGGGINHYTESNKTGLMYGGRVGFWGGGIALNGEAYYVGKFSDSVSWRVGGGLEYLQGTGIFSGANGVFPILSASIGFRL